MELLIFVALGFVAQMIDGALGMAYGVTANSLLIAFGVNPAAASASVHISEVFTTLVSGISHYRLGNVDKDFIKRLAIPGVIGGIVGAYLLSNIGGSELKPFIAIYLLLMGIRILIKAINYPKRQQAEPPMPGKWQLELLGLVGGFFDAVGGGGWGPIVTSSLISRGHSPAKTIGSVNISEFFVTLVEAATFIVLIGVSDWIVILGFIIGGVIAAPLGAHITKRINPRVLMFIVAILIIGLQIRQILLSWVL
ncbi:MAG: sulfite exporter TauE/SafE family protein [Anaerolineae bacterium]|jgi:uncharacterized membrane protein YfcA|nr:sulfite exporter TauE/SafE family protein [Anaerolineae bacterium]